MSVNITGYTKLIFLALALVFYWGVILMLNKKHKLSNTTNIGIALIALCIAALPSFIALQRPLWEKLVALILCGVIGILYVYGLQGLSKLVGRIIRSGLKNVDEKSTSKEGRNNSDKYKHK